MSTDSDEQLTSYEAQVNYYTNYIQSKSEWKFVALYSDEGVSGVSTKKRDGFNRMIADALNGKIDLIITKSVSRFARNTVDTLTTVRKLKEKGVEVYFEKESIFTLDSKGELLITIMSSLAQEESRSMSENIKWGHQKRFADGKINLPYRQFLGYEKGDDGLPKVVPEQALIVKRIYRDFLLGRSVGTIAKGLTADGISTPAGKDIWTHSTVKSILCNEKYCGNAILQKRFVADFLTKKQKDNKGEYPKYFVEGSHEPIISVEIFEMVQAEMKKRSESKVKKVGDSVFSGMVFCEDCGSVFTSKVWHSNDKYRRVIWQCINKFEKGKVKCSTQHFSEEQLKDIFVMAFNEIFNSKDEVLTNLQMGIYAITDTTEIEKQCSELQSELEIVTGLIHKHIEDNATNAIDQEIYAEGYSRLMARHNTVKSRLEELTQERENRKAEGVNIDRFMAELRKQEHLITEFDEQLFAIGVERMVACSDGGVRVVFKDGRRVKG